MGQAHWNSLSYVLVFAAFACSPAFPQQAQQNDQLPDSPTPTLAAKSESAPPPFSSSSLEEADVPSAPPHITTHPGAEVTVLEDTLLRVRTTSPLNTNMSREGSPILFTLSEDVAVDNVLILPRGAAIHGIVVQSKKSGTLTGAPDLILKLTALELTGRTYPVYSYQFKVEGMSKTKPTQAKIKGGAVVGALVGTSLNVGRSTVSAAEKLATIGTGAVLGAGVGTAAAAASSGPAVNIPAEAQIDFYLASPISVLPPTADEAALLAPRLHPGEPVLYVHGETP